MLVLSTELELKRIINEREYNALARLPDPSRHVIMQQRISFIWAKRYYCVVRYDAPTKAKGITVLYVQLRGDGDEQMETSAIVPPFLNEGGTAKDVTQDKGYSSHTLSLKTK